VLVVGVEKMPKGIIRSSFFAPWQEEAGLSANPAYFALRAQRLLRDQGLGVDDLAAPVVKNRRWGTRDLANRPRPPADGVDRAALDRGPDVGPCTKATTNRPLLASGGDQAGPGGACVVTGSAGDQWPAYHAWTPSAIGYDNDGNRSLRFASLALPDGQPAVRR
jgi:hypothetical protein